jgi:hypothetical protein
MSDVRQTEMHTAEPLIPQPRTFKVETATEKLERYKSPGTDQIPAEMIKVRGIIPYILRSTNLLIIFWIRKNCDNNGKNLLLLCLFIKRNYRGISLLQAMYEALSSIFLSKLTPCVDKINGDHLSGF